MTTESNAKGGDRVRGLLIKLAQGELQPDEQVRTFQDLLHDDPFFEAFVLDIEQLAAAAASQAGREREADSRKHVLIDGTEAL